ncbi:MAG: prolyl oligopeptidase family serine peptidase [Flavobacteriales bacterium]|nr:prolyl oligopeptidase family serine peptidase [Flavobacteriales bacterium]
MTENTPPTFLVHSSDDDVVPVKNSLLYYEALQEKGVSAEIHIYPYGGHGFSLAINKGHLSTWIGNCTYWIKYTTNNKIKTQK